ALALKHCHGFERTIAHGVKYAFKGHVPVPTTIAWGTRDVILPYSSSAIAQERLPEARHVALPHCGHVPMIDDPDLIVRVVQQTTAVAAQAPAA
ncbi:MAG: alpha/beta hydrolase, partial [Aeromicrobium sp.]